MALIRCDLVYLRLGIGQSRLMLRWNMTRKVERNMIGQMDTFGLSDIGLVRENNEDQFLIADLKKSVIIHQTSLSYDDETHLLGGSQAKLLLVADGVGGGPDGDRASRMAVQGIVQYLLNTMHWLFRLNDGREDAFLDDLKGALVFTQDKLQQHAARMPSGQQMGTTITLAYIVWPQVYLVHVGDSRAYVFRDQEVIHLTHDQTYAQALVDAGIMHEADVRKSVLRHVLSGLVGCNPKSLTPEVSQFKLTLQDKLLLCTDGLTAELTDAKIAAILSEDKSAEDASHRLINAANHAGGRDNVTVVMAHFTDKAPDSLKHKEEVVEDRLATHMSAHEQMFSSKTATSGSHQMTPAEFVREADLNSSVRQLKY